MRCLLLSFCALLISLFPFLPTEGAAGQPPERIADFEAGETHPVNGSNEDCRIELYNTCSRWIWLWSGAQQGDRIGVVYDLAAECGGGDNACINLHNWWYWRYTFPNYCPDFSVSYLLYNVDESNELVGEAIGAFANQCPIERWNFFPGLGQVTSGRAALVAEWDTGSHPYGGSDNNEKNADTPDLCEGVGPGNGTSLRYIWHGEQLSPPEVLDDALGPVDLLVVSVWDCTSTTAAERSSWTDLKVLFQ